MDTQTQIVVNASAARPGRINGKNSKYRSTIDKLPHKISNEIHILLQENRDKAINNDKSVGASTQEERTKRIFSFFSELYRLKYKLESVKNLKRKHVVAVFNYLEEQGQSPSILQNKISTMRGFCGWIGKHGLINDSDYFVVNPLSTKRTMVVKEDKSWIGNGIDAMDLINKISEFDKNVGISLEICFAFGLRVQESVMIRPLASDEGLAIWVMEGTKGKRSRVIPFENEIQRQIIDRAKLMSHKGTGFLWRKQLTLEQKLNRFYYVMKKFGLTFSDKGVTAHGLRHQYMHESYKLLTGHEPPVKGGDVNKIDENLWVESSQKLMERAGHTRVTIGASYYGSRRRKKSIPTDTD